MALTQTDLAQVRQQIRLIMDPMLMRLRTELFNGNVYYPTLTDGLISTTVIQQGVQDGIEQAVEQGGLVPSIVQFIAGEEIQTGKVVYYNGTNVMLASPTNSSHAGKIIGIAASPATNGETINIQMYGIMTSEVLSFASPGTLFLGTSSFPSLTIPGGATYVQIVGVSMGGNKLLVVIDPGVIVT